MAELANLSDDDLLGHVRRGEEEAFAILYRRHQAGIYGFALQMSGSTSVAEEVTQETFLALMNQADQYDPSRGPLVSYLYGIARNQVLRSLGRDRPHIPMSDGSPNGHGAIPEELVVKEDPLRGLTRQERIESIRQAISTLPAHYREMVVLCDLQETSYAEAAAVVGCSVGTVRSRLHRARALLLKRLTAVERRHTEKINRRGA